MTENEYFLGDGDYTKIDWRIKKVADKIKRNRSQNRITGINNVVYSLEHNISNKRREFRNRTASEIISSGYTTGCTDDALVFCAVARATGIPTKYVETIHNDWLKDPHGRTRVHVFVDIYTRGEWFAYNPNWGYCWHTKTSKVTSDYNAFRENFVLVGKGLDFSNVNVSVLNDNFRLKTLDEILDVAIKMNIFDESKKHLVQNPRSYSSILAPQ